MSWTESVEPVFNGLNLTQLNIDQYYLNFTSSEYTEKLYLYFRYEDCYNCPYTRHKIINNGIDFKNGFQRLSAQPAEQWRIMKENKLTMSSVDSSYDVVCDIEPKVGEFGVYSLNVAKDNCELVVLKEPVNIYLSILTVFFIVLGISIFCYGTVWSINKYITKRKEREEQGKTDINVNLKVPQGKKQRVKALDTFRGISIVIMIFVNYGSGKYEFLEHATWNGLHVADLVFPWFMWIMGVCIPISIRSATKGDACRIKVFLNILRRSCILFLLGVILNQGVKLDTIRIFGVLQRFGICYFIVATLGLLFSNIQYQEPKSKFSKIFYDVIVLLPQWAIVLIIMTVHLLITFTIDVPGCPMGYLGPGGIQNDGKYKDCIGGATGYIDKIILGNNHIYQHPTATVIYQSGPFDPEGVFGTLMSIVQVFLGVQAGSIILIHMTYKGRVLRWLAWALTTGLIGGILCGFSKEEGIIPVNKNLWSLSFVLVTSCFAFILLSVCYILIDVLRWWSGKPFIFAGMNATIMYVGHSLTYMFPFHWAVTPMNTHFLYLLRHVWGTVLWILIAYDLFRKKFFLSI